VARPAERTGPLELSVAAIPPLDHERTVGRAAASPGRQRRRRRCVADDRQYRDPGTPLCRRHKKGIRGQSLGRSRGGFSTKIHLRTNAEGLPIGIVLTPGECHDSTAYPDLMAERDSDPGMLLADRGYDSDAIRQDARDRGAAPEIPTKRNRIVQYSVNRRVYALRNRIERCFNRLKNSRRVATRYDQDDTSFLGFVLLAAIRLWFRFVHAA
jgi:transposase